MHGPTKRIAPIVAALAAVVAACGGGDADDPEALTKTQWVASANAICVDMYDELDKVPEPRTPEEMGEAGRLVTDIHRTALAELRALVPPAGEKSAIEEVLAAAEATIDWGEEFTQAVAAGDDERASLLMTEGERLVAESDRLFEDYGLMDCLEAAG